MDQPRLLSHNVSCAIVLHSCFSDFHGDFLPINVSINDVLSDVFAAVDAFEYLFAFWRTLLGSVYPGFELNKVGPARWTSDVENRGDVYGAIELGSLLH